MVMISNECLLGGMETANILMEHLVDARMAKMAILVRKHDNFLMKNRTAMELPCSLTKIVSFGLWTPNSRNQVNGE